jgi:predicted Zn finger-like uncharacterized protein
MPVGAIQIGDCPKCGTRTFVIYEKVGGFGGGGLKGKCYKCGHSVDNI